MTRSRALLILHITVFIWGFTGILGNEISLPSNQLVWWRMLIAAVAMLTWALFSKKSLQVQPRELLSYIGVGLLTAAHWICFFGSIKASNVSTALAVISTTSFFVAFVAPFIRKEKFLWFEVILGVLVVAGLAIIFKFESDKTLGIVLSLCAALLAAIFSSWNSVLVKTYPPTKMAFYEMLAGFVGVSIYLMFNDKLDSSLFAISGYDYFLLAILGIVATAFAYIVSIEVMKILSPFTCALTINLEPLYTIAMALIIYGESEYMSPQFYFGSLLILSTLFIDVYARKKLSSQKS
ncbi:MAG: DMT family transporter [Flavobacteriales bacterium]